MPFGTGAKERPEDPRDFQLAQYQPPVSIPAVFMQDISAIPVKNQSKFGTCGGHAGGMLDSKLQTDKRGTVQDLSPKYLWKRIKLVDNWKQNGWTLDQGTDMRSIFKALQGSGDCYEHTMPDVIDATIEQYTDPSVITPAINAEAGQNIIGNYAFNDFPTWDELRQAIYLNKGVLALIDVSDAWWVPSWSEKDIMPLRFTQRVSGHFVMLYGYDEKYIYFRNSWSLAWGKQGDGYFGKDYMPYVREIGTTLVLPAPYIFTSDLQVGMTGKAVTELQKRFNAHPETQVATTGPGSPGNETTTFGPLTKIAAQKYQKLKNLPQTGYVGPMTRAVLNTTT